MVLVGAILTAQCANVSTLEAGSYTVTFTGARVGPGPPVHVEVIVVGPYRFKLESSVSVSRATSVSWQGLPSEGSFSHIQAAASVSLDGCVPDLAADAGRSSRIFQRVRAVPHATLPVDDLHGARFGRGEDKRKAPSFVRVIGSGQDDIALQSAHPIHRPKMPFLRVATIADGTIGARAMQQIVARAN